MHEVLNFLFSNLTLCKIWLHKKFWERALNWSVTSYAILTIFENIKRAVFMRLHFSWYCNLYPKKVESDENFIYFSSLSLKVLIKSGYRLKTVSLHFRLNKWIAIFQLQNSNSHKKSCMSFLDTLYIYI